MFWLKKNGGVPSSTGDASISAGFSWSALLWCTILMLPSIANAQNVSPVCNFQPQTFNIASTATGVQLGSPTALAATDANGDTLSYQIQGTGNPFTIDLNSGIITTAAGMANNREYSFNVVVDDGNSGTAVCDVLVVVGTVTGVCSATPTFTIPSGAGTAGAAVGTYPQTGPTYEEVATAPLSGSLATSATGAITRANTITIPDGTYTYEILVNGKICPVTIVVGTSCNSPAPTFTIPTSGTVGQAVGTYPQTGPTYTEAGTGQLVADLQISATGQITRQSTAVLAAGTYQYNVLLGGTQCPVTIVVQAGCNASPPTFTLPSTGNINDFIGTYGQTGVTYQESVGTQLANELQIDPNSGSITRQSTGPVASGTYTYQFTVSGILCSATITVPGTCATKPTFTLNPTGNIGEIVGSYGLGAGTYIETGSTLINDLNIDSNGLVTRQSTTSLAAGTYTYTFTINGVACNLDIIVGNPCTQSTMSTTDTFIGNVASHPSGVAPTYSEVANSLSTPNPAAGFLNIDNNGLVTKTSTAAVGTYNYAILVNGVNCAIQVVVSNAALTSSCPSTTFSLSGPLNAGVQFGTFAINNPQAGVTYSLATTNQLAGINVLTNGTLQTSQALNTGGTLRVTATQPGFSDITCDVIISIPTTTSCPFTTPTFTITQGFSGTPPISVGFYSTAANTNYLEVNNGATNPLLSTFDVNPTTGEIIVTTGVTPALGNNQQYLITVNGTQCPVNINVVASASCATTSSVTIPNAVGTGAAIFTYPTTGFTEDTNTANNPAGVFLDYNPTTRQIITTNGVTAVPGVYAYRLLNGALVCTVTINVTGTSVCTSPIPSFTITPTTATSVPTSVGGYQTGFSEVVNTGTNNPAANFLAIDPNTGAITVPVGQTPTTAGSPFTYLVSNSVTTCQITVFVSGTTVCTSPIPSFTITPTTATSVPTSVGGYQTGFSEVVNTGTNNPAANFLAIDPNTGAITVPVGSTPTTVGSPFNYLVSKSGTTCQISVTVSGTPVCNGVTNNISIQNTVNQGAVISVLPSGATYSESTTAVGNSAAPFFDINVNNNLQIIRSGTAILNAGVYTYVLLINGQPCSITITVNGPTACPVVNNGFTTTSTSTVSTIGTIGTLGTTATYSEDTNVNNANPFANFVSLGINGAINRDNTAVSIPAGTYQYRVFVNGQLCQIPITVTANTVGCATVSNSFSTTNVASSVLTLGTYGLGSTGANYLELANINNVNPAAAFLNIDNNGVISRTTAAIPPATYNYCFTIRSGQQQCCVTVSVTTGICPSVTTFTVNTGVGSGTFLGQLTGNGVTYAVASTTTNNNSRFTVINNQLLTNTPGTVLPSFPSTYLFDVTATAAGAASSVCQLTITVGNTCGALSCAAAIAGQCQTGGGCANGACVSVITCASPNQCQQGGCVNGNCIPLTPANNGLFCTLNGVVNGGACSNGACIATANCQNIFCSQPGPCQTGGGCNVQTNTCGTIVQIPNGSPCNNQLGICQNNVCISGNLCNNNNNNCQFAGACQTGGGCNSLTGGCIAITNINTGGSCTTNLGLTGFCQGGTCVPNIIGNLINIFFEVLLQNRRCNNPPSQTLINSILQAIAILFGVPNTSVTLATPPFCRQAGFFPTLAQDLQVQHQHPSKFETEQLATPPAVILTGQDVNGDWVLQFLVNNAPASLTSLVNQLNTAGPNVPSQLQGLVTYISQAIVNGQPTQCPVASCTNPVQCLVNPCTVGAGCGGYPGAVCCPNYCGGCSATWYWNGQPVQCQAPGPVCPNNGQCNPWQMSYIHLVQQLAKRY